MGFQLGGLRFRFGSRILEESPATRQEPAIAERNANILTPSSVWGVQGLGFTGSGALGLSAKRLDLKCHRPGWLGLAF